MATKCTRSINAGWLRNWLPTSYKSSLFDAIFSQPVIVTCNTALPVPLMFDIQHRVIITFIHSVSLLINIKH